MTRRATSPPSSSTAWPSIWPTRSASQYVAQASEALAAANSLTGFSSSQPEADEAAHIADAACSASLFLGQVSEAAAATDAAIAAVLTQAAATEAMAVLNLNAASFCAWLADAAEANAVRDVADDQSSNIGDLFEGMAAQDGGSATVATASVLAEAAVLADSAAAKAGLAALVVEVDFAGDCPLSGPIAFGARWTRAARPTTRWSCTIRCRARPAPSPWARQAATCGRPPCSTIFPSPRLRATTGWHVNEHVSDQITPGNPNTVHLDG